MKVTGFLVQPSTERIVDAFLHEYAVGADAVLACHFEFADERAGDRNKRGIASNFEGSMPVWLWK